MAERSPTKEDEAQARDQALRDTNLDRLLDRGLEDPDLIKATEQCIQIIEGDDELQFEMEQEAPGGEEVVTTTRRCSTPHKIFEWDGKMLHWKDKTFHEKTMDRAGCDVAMYSPTSPEYVPAPDFTLTKTIPLTTRTRQPPDGASSPEYTPTTIAISEETDTASDSDDCNTSSDEYSTCDENDDAVEQLTRDDTYDRRPIKSEINQAYLFSSYKKQMQEIKAIRRAQVTREQAWMRKRAKKALTKDPWQVYRHDKCGHNHIPGKSCPMLESSEHCFGKGKKADAWCQPCITYWRKGAAHLCLEKRCHTCAGARERFEKQNPDVFRPAAPERRQIQQNRFLVRIPDDDENM